MAILKYRNSNGDLVGVNSYKVTPVDVEGINASIAQNASAIASNAQAIAQKADSSSVYSKSEVDTKVNAANTAINSKLPIDSFNEWSQGVAMKSEMEGNVDELNEAIDLKADASAVYTKTDVDAIVDSIECDGGEY